MKPALDLQRDGDDGAHPRVHQQWNGAGHRGQVLVDGGHPGRAVAPGARFDGDAGEALAGGGQPGGGADLQLGLVVGGEQQIGGVAVEHVAGPLDGALEQTVEVVGGRGADEHLEGVGGLAPIRGVGGVDVRTAHRTLQYGALAFAHQQTDGGRLALGIADTQMGGVDGSDPAVGAADAVGALPAREEERLGDAGAGAGGVGPCGEVGQRLADDLLRWVAEQLLSVVVPGADQTAAVDLDDSDPDSGVGDGQGAGGQGGPGRSGSGRAVGEIEMEPDLLVSRGVLDAPAAA